MIDRSNLHGDINADIYYKYDLNLCKTSNIIAYFCFMLLRYKTFLVAYSNDIFTKRIYLKIDDLEHSI